MEKSNMNTLKVGVIGPDVSIKSNLADIWEKLSTGFNLASRSKPDATVEVVSTGLDEGINVSAYRLAKQKNMVTTGISSDAVVMARNSGKKKGFKHKIYPVDNFKRVKKGNETKELLNYVDCLVALGTSRSIGSVVKAAREKGLPVYSYELED